MSYDYDALVNKIICGRQQYYQEIIQEQQKTKKNDNDTIFTENDDNNVENDDNENENNSNNINTILMNTLTTFEQLSTYCPMTVLLWMKYSQTMYWYMNNIIGTSSSSNTSSSSSNSNNNSKESWKMRLQIIELGLLEYPGSTLLHVYYINLLYQYYILFYYVPTNSSSNDIIINNNNEYSEVIQSIYTAFSNTFTTIGIGSHRNEDTCILYIYNLYRTFLIKQHTQQQQLETQQTQQQPLQTHTPLVINEVLNTFVQQSYIPMKYCNDSIQQQLNDYCNTITSLKVSDPTMKQPHKQQHDHELEYYKRIIQNKIDTNRISISKLYSNRFITYEDTIESLMKHDTIWIPWDTILNTTTSNNSVDDSFIDIDWDELLQDNVDTTTSTSSTTGSMIGMGYGTNDTATAFIRYARALLIYHIPKHSTLRSNNNNNEENTTNTNNDKDEQLMKQIGWCVYERGIVECPTNDIVWLSYIRSLIEMIDTSKENDEHSSSTSSSTYENSDNKQKLCTTLQSVCNRAIRNCPYSIKLIQQQINIQYYLIEYKIIPAIEPSLLLNIIDTAIRTKFIDFSSSNSNNLFDLYITCIRVMKRRLITLLCKLKPVYGMDNNNNTINTDKRRRDNKKSSKEATKMKQLLHYDDSEQFDTKYDEKNNQKRSNNKNKNGMYDNDSYNNIIDENALNEIEDLADDIREMFDEIDKRLILTQEQSTATNNKVTTKNNKKTKNNNNDTTTTTTHQQQQQDDNEEEQTTITKVPIITSHDRALLLKERSITESLLLNGILASSNDDENDIDNDNKKYTSGEKRILDNQLAIYEKSIRVHNPPHPDFYIKFIEQYKNNISVSYLMSDNTGGENNNDGVDDYNNNNIPTQYGTVLSNLRRIRYLYDKAIVAVGNPYIVSTNMLKRQKQKNSSIEQQQHVPTIPMSVTVPLQDYNTSLHCLCTGWIEFEHMFGSERSILRAEKVIKKKFEKNTSSQQSQLQSQSTTARNSTVQSTTVPIATTTNHHDDDLMILDETDTTHSNIVINKTASESGSSFVDPNTEMSTNKRKTSQDEVDEEHLLSLPTSKKVKLDIHNMDELEINQKRDNTVEDNVIVENSEGKIKAATSLPKVKVGNLEYPAHPYTVRVSQLRYDVCDMDLVDALRSRCGAIVHARLIREKGDHSHASSSSSSNNNNNSHLAHKGWGLVQFEERDSVTKALELHDTISIKEKLVRIERSHIPAVSLVPPGMHRVSPVGTGKVSKRNEKVRQQRQQTRDGNNQIVLDNSAPSLTDMTIESQQNAEVSKPKIEPAVTAKSMAVPKAANPLSFRPRAVARASGSVRKQPKLSIDRNVIKGQNLEDK